MEWSCSGTSSAPSASSSTVRGEAAQAPVYSSTAQIWAHTEAKQRAPMTRQQPRLFITASCSAPHLENRFRLFLFPGGQLLRSSTELTSHNDLQNNAEEKSMSYHQPSQQIWLVKLALLTTVPILQQVLGSP